MKRSPMQRGSGFKRQEYVPAPPAPPRPASRRAQMVVSSFTTTVPKEPADRNEKLKALAQGEACTVLRYNGYCRCSPETTVLAHTNTQADQKGMGYKGHDTSGFFAGYECHAYIDQPPPGASRDEIEALVLAAQQRTRARLRELASSVTARAWKKLAAIEVLLQLEARGET